jgi:DNA repair exonuclease SbcCD ATPase subunit
MNLLFKKIYIQGFQSVDTIELELDDRGILVVKGINNYESNVKSNGSGKSSIFESIIFALYGETSLGIKDPENRVLNNGYTVKLDLSIDGVDYTINRYKTNNKSNVQFIQNNNDISGRNKTDTDKIIQRELGISKELFLDSIFLAQGVSTNLSSLSPTARKERLEILTGTEKLIEEFKAYIKERQLEYESKCTELTLAKTKLDGNIQSLNGQISTLKSKIIEINNENERNKSLGNIDDLNYQIQQIENEISVIEVQTIPNIEHTIEQNQTIIDTYKNQKLEMESKKEEINNTLNQQRDVVYNINSGIDKLNNDINTSRREISRIQSDIETIRNSDTCPTCGRKYDNINEDHINMLIEGYNKDISEHDNKISELNAVIVTETDKLNMETTKGKAIREEYDSIQNDIQKINNDIQVKEAENQGKSREIKEQRDIISNKQYQIKGLQAKKEELLKIEIKSTTEYEDMIKDAEDKINKSSLEIRDIQEEWAKQNDLVDVCKYSQQLITKPFRTYLLQNSINLLNEKLHHLSTKLFSNDKDVIYIDGDDSKLDIRLGNATYESLSGGEKTRVNMCLLLAQKYLASNLGNIDCNIIVLDEVLGQCDSEAEINIIDLIIEELQSVSSIIFIGHKELSIPNDEIITVVKDEHGLSRLLR